MSKIILEEQVTPATPASDKVALYPMTGGEFYRKNDEGAEDQLLTADKIDDIVCHDGVVVVHDGNVVIN